MILEIKKVTRKIELDTWYCGYGDDSVTADYDSSICDSEIGVKCFDLENGNSSNGVVSNFR